jgi:hypothetical protein
MGEHPHSNVGLLCAPSHKLKLKHQDVTKLTYVQGI